MWRGAIVAGMVLAGVVAAPSAAAAAGPGQVRPFDLGCDTNVKIHTGPHLSSTALGICATGDIVEDHGEASGDLVTCPAGNGDAAWDNITDLRTGVRGYVSECYLSTGWT
jgi:hypothetical protein